MTRGTLVLTAFALAACGKAGGEVDTRPRHVVEGERVAGPDAGARTVDDLSIEPDKAFETSGCEQRYPSVGMRFVEETDYELVTPPGYQTASHDLGAIHMRGRTAVTLDEVSGAEILRAKIVDQGWFVDKTAPEERGAASAHDVAVGDGGKLTKTERWGKSDFVDDFDQSIAGPDGFGVLVARGSIAALERAVLNLDLGRDSEGTSKSTLRLSNRRHAGMFDTFDVEENWTENSVGMSQWTTKEFTTTGTLVLRAADGAFVELTQSGAGRTRSGVSPYVVAPGTPTTGRAQQVTIRTRRSWPCFRAAIAE
ncbi:MAG TPA: hypothetical protein VIF62_00265 [Labilithrix sp.]|jgi:hypothetical protein